MSTSETRDRDSSSRGSSLSGKIKSMPGSFRRFQEARPGSLRRYLVLLFLIPLGYLSQVCIIPYFSLGGVTPNLLFAVIGIAMRMIGKKPQQKHMGDILLGFTVLMYGMQSMSGAVSPLKESQEFISLLTTFSHPLVGILVGAVFTAILQSASAAVGILQALSATGAISFSVAYPIILGIAVGASVPVLLSSIGAKVDGRRTAFLYLFVEAVAAVLFAALYYAIDAIVGLGIGGRIMDPFSIAAVNTAFRVASPRQRSLSASARAR